MLECVGKYIAGDGVKTGSAANFFAGESFEVGGVGHVVWVVESVDLFPQRDNKLVRQRH
jgi:hypothetical protein